MGYSLFAQEDFEEKKITFSGKINITNNGFSFIPLFSLGKPATTVNLSVGGKRFSFDPQLRFDLDGMRPWSFLFNWHYKLIQKKKLQARIGGYFPAFAFTKLEYTRMNEIREVLTPQRFFIWTFNLNYQLTKNTSVGFFYLNGNGLEKVDQTDKGNFLSFRTNFNNIRLNKSWSLSFNPEIYFLKIDENQGFYAAQTLSIKHEKIPLFLSSTMNKALNSNLNAKGFDWNIGINYVFNTTYVKTYHKK